MDVWKKLREDGALGFQAVVRGVRASVRRGGAVPDLVRLRWRIRENRAALDSAFEDLGRYLSTRLIAGGAVEPSDDEVRTRCQHIAMLRMEERRLEDEWSARALE